MTDAAYTLRQIQDLIKGRQIIIGIGSIRDQLTRENIEGVQARRGGEKCYSAAPVDEMINSYYPDPSAPIDYSRFEASPQCPGVRLQSPSNVSYELVPIQKPVLFELDLSLIQKPAPTFELDPTLLTPQPEPEISYRFGLPISVILNTILWKEDYLELKYDSRLKKTGKPRGHKFRL